MRTPLRNAFLQGDLDANGHTIIGFGAVARYFDVKSYGALGDGATDDTTAIQAALAAIPATGGVLYFPSGYYIYTGATLALDKPVTVMGDGGAIGGLSLLLTMADITPAISTIDFNSGTASLFEVTSDGCIFKDIEFLNSHGTDPTSGAAVLVTNHGDFTQFRNITVSGFYRNINVQQGASILWDGCIIIDPVLEGVRVDNTLNGDLGDHCISNCWFFGGPSNPSAALTGMLEGMKVINTKFNAGLGGVYVDMISVVSAGATGDLFIANCGFENFTGTAIKGRQSGGAYNNVLIVGCQIAPILGGQIGIDLNGDFRNVILTGNWGLTGSSPQPFITLTGCGNVVVVGNSAVGYSAILTTSGCTFATPIGSVPAGGTTGQSLKKLSNSDYDVGWV